MATRGRPRTFDVDHALDRALDQFWARGFAATSLDDLSAAMGIARPSLYAAFGDKEALYLRALARFGERVAALARTAFAEPSARAGILAFQRATIGLYTSGPAARGCMIACTAVAEAPSRAPVRAALTAGLAALDDGFVRALTRARAQGELAGDADVTALGRLLGATQTAIALRARAGASVDELVALGRAAVDAVFGAPPSRPRRARTAARLRVRRAPPRRRTR